MPLQICGQLTEQWPVCTFTIAKILAHIVLKNSCRLKVSGLPEKINVQMTQVAYMSDTLRDCLTLELRLVIVTSSASLLTSNAAKHLLNLSFDCRQA